MGAAGRKEGLKLENNAEATHTPGPWSVNPTGDIGPWHVGSHEYGPVCDCADTIAGDLVANARLIAAAPEMYHLLLELEWLGDALEPKCIICGKYMDDGHAGWCDIGTVLRKVRGEE